MVSSQFFNQICDRGLAIYLFLYNRIISSIAKKLAEMDDELLSTWIYSPA